METVAFGQACRRWRGLRKMSQLDLALVAEVSQRHISFLETGRSRPSRAMVSRIAAALDIPLRERNPLLTSAGFAARYHESSLDDDQMKPVRAALTQLLEHHEPLPALVVDRFWTIQQSNRATQALTDLIVPMLDDPAEVSVDGKINLALLTLSPAGMRPLIGNFGAVASMMLQRLRREQAASPADDFRAFVNRIESEIGPVNPEEASQEPMVPVVPLKLRLGDLVLNLFSVISTFGTPHDITTDELKIELFYPSDDETGRFFKRLAR